MKNTQLRFISFCFTLFCLAWGGLAPLALAQAPHSIIINSDPGDTIYGNGDGPNGSDNSNDNILLSANNNEVTIDADVAGGKSVFGASEMANGSAGTAMENKVTVNNGRTLSGDANGAYASSNIASATASQNDVVINGTVSGAVRGGQASVSDINSDSSVTATANDNSVTINDGTAGGVEVPGFTAARRPPATALRPRPRATA